MFRPKYDKNTILKRNSNKLGFVESRDDLTQFSTIYQWLKTLIHPALMQRHKLIQHNLEPGF
ncbi:hypothetical protein RintRC_5592 [Richelia intracellularis]|nr:hypothetical protein RintRC_5592 [Richelia intracellularis]